jgi:thioredoxin-like negative regulator of GroEL
VLALAVNDGEQAMRDFMDAGGWIFPVMLAGDNVAGSYGVRAIPTLVLVRPGGRIAKTIVGGVTAEDLAALVDELSP